MRNLKRKEEGANGIATLMIFIAIVLVAAVASNVLIDTVNKLQQQSQKTGEQAILDVSTAFKIMDYSCINYENFGSNDIEEINLKVGLYGGSSPQDLLQTLIQLQSDYKDASLTAAYDIEKKADEEVFAWEPILKQENNDYNSSYVQPGDMYKITINLIAEDELNQAVIGSLGPQDTLDVRITPKHGTTTYEEIVVPSILSGSSIISTTKEAVQLDFSNIYDSDTVITKSEAEDGIQESDGFFDSWAGFITQAVAEEEGSETSKGLPNDGDFSSDANHPKVNLAWDGENTWKAEGVGDQVTAGVSDENYDKIHIFTSAAGAGSGNPAEYTITLNYADGSQTTSQDFTTPDWIDSKPNDGYYLIENISRYDFSDGVSENKFSIFGHSMDVDGSKILTSVTIEITELEADVFGFFGGVGKPTGTD